jgi:hypothetical protein
MKCVQNVEQGALYKTNIWDTDKEIEHGVKMDLEEVRCVVASGSESYTKSNPITGLGRPLGFQEVEASRFLDSRHMKVVSLPAQRTGRFLPPPPVPPRKHSWYSLLLEAESTPGPWWDRKDYVNEKFQ